MKSVLVAYDIDTNCQLAAFINHFSRLLRKSDDDVTILTAGISESPLDELERATYRAWGIEVIHVSPPVRPVPAWPDTHDRQLSDEIAAHISLADVVYFSNHHNPAFHTIRHKRFTGRRTPVCVTVLHDDIDQKPDYARTLQYSIDPFANAFADRYSLAYSDFVVSPGEHILAQVVDKGWALPAPGRVKVLGNPELSSDQSASTSTAANQAWLAFHEEVCRYARQDRSRSVSVPRSAAEGHVKAVDICVAYFNHAKYLPQLLLSLEAQTYQDFNVIIVDDGSTDAQAIAVFEEMQKHYGPRGWRFLHQENAYPGAARNHAVRCGTADYLVFIDTDDVAAPTMVEHFLAAMQHSGDDCITCNYYYFRDEHLPFDLDTGEVLEPAFYVFSPLGGDLTVGMMDGVYGGVVMIIRRKVFDAVGGFTEQRGVGYEDWELYIRLLLAGYTVDVLPESLVFVRAVEGSIMRSTDEFNNFRRGLGVYESYLRDARLVELPTAIHSEYMHLHALGQQRDQLLAQLQQLKEASQKKL